MLIPVTDNARLRQFRKLFLPNVSGSRAYPLKWHLVLLVTGALLPVVAFAIVIVHQLSVGEREATERRTLVAARNLAEAVEQETSGTIRILEALAASEQLEQRNLDAFYREAVRVLGSQPTWSTIILLTPEGQQILNARQPFGAILPLTNEPDSLRRTLETRQPTIGDLARNQVGGALAFPIRVPVFRDEELVYVLTARITPEALTQEVEKQTPIDGEWTRTVVDGKGIVVARTRNPEKFVGQRGTLPFLRQIGAAPEGVYRDITLDGEHVYVAFSRLNDSRWTGAVTIPIRVVEGPARQAIALVGGAGILLLMLSVAAAIALSESITRSIASATAGAEALVRGETPRVGFTSIQEVGMLGKALEFSANLLTQRDQERAEHLARAEAARAEAEAANRLKDEFLITISHELKTPLNAILGWSVLLQSGRLDRERTEQAIATIERNAKAQSRLVDDLLDTSRIVTGKLRLEPQRVHLATVITSAVDSIRHAADAKHIHLSLHLEPNMEPIQGDMNRLQQVVWNLLSNAVKFTPAGGQVTVELRSVEDWVEVVVRDTGKGIRPEFLPHVFDRFRQADSSTTREFGGLGLGLAIVRHLVELHGGMVWADSEGLDRGAAFTLRFPKAHQTTWSVPPEAGVRLNQTSTTHLMDSGKLHGVRILVVDDELDAREFVATVLMQQGADIRVCASAVEAFQEVMNWNPAVILSDIGMPLEDGYTFIARVRKAGSGIPAIALTAFTREEDQERAIAAGFQRHLAKPIDPMELVTVVAHLVSP